MLWLSERTLRPQQSEVIIVFPGFPPGRVDLGYQLAQKGFAPNLAVISKSARQLQRESRKRGSLGTVRPLSSGKSRSTFEDVYNAARILRENNLHSLLLVTSSYHLPRAFLLLKVFLLGSGVEIHACSLPLAQAKNVGPLLRGKLYLNELVKLWGSAVEMLGYRVSGTLLLDVPIFWEFRQFLKKTMLFAV